MKNKRIFFNLSFISILILLYIIYVAVLSPISMKVSTDIIYSEGYIPMMIDICFELCQLLIWCHLFSFIIGSLLLYGSANSVIILSCASFITLLRYIAAPIIDVTLNGSALAPQDMTDALLYFFLDFAQIIAALLISSIIIKIKKSKIAAGFCAVMVSAVRVIMRIRYDFFYGPPADFRDLMWMIIYYASDLIYGLIAYFVILSVVRLICRNKASVI